MWPGFHGRVLLVVAHPDDETLACGGGMVHAPDCVILHTTDGSPRLLKDAQGAGFSSREAYAAARRRELDCALAHVGDRPTRCLDLVDQDSWRDLAALSRRVLAVLEELRPDTVVTHPFEGGHPDHDAAAFAVQQACTMLNARAPVRMEAAFYHRFEGRFRTNEFLPGGLPVTEISLDRDSELRKKAMLACFASQAAVLSVFSTSVERYRTAPSYSFTEPPHAGLLNYETLGWGITSAAWLAEARRSLDALAS